MHRNKYKNKRKRNLVFLVGTFILPLFFLVIIINDPQSRMKENNLMEKNATEIIEQTIKKNPSMKNISFEREKNSNIIHYTSSTKKEKEEILNELEKQTKKAISEVTGSKALILSYINETEFNNKFSHRLVVTESFHWNQEQKLFELYSKKEMVVSIVLTETRQEIKLNDLVKSEADLLAIHRIIQQEILSLNLKVENKIDKVLKMKRLTLECNVRVLPTYLKVELDDSVFGITKVDILYNKISHFIDTSIIDDIEKPKNKLEEEKKYVALTFDDGPNRTSTNRLLDILKKEEVSATFFVLGEMVDANPEVAQRIVYEKHEIANHSFSHPDLTSISLDQVSKEVIETDRSIYNAVGILPTNFRAPYGSINKQVAREIGLPIIQWSTDSQDWRLKDKDKIIEEVMGSVQNGAIILLHDIHETSIDAVPELIKQLKSQGYEFLTVDNLLSGMQKPLSQYFGKDSERLIE